MSQYRHERAVGDIQSPFAVQLTQSGLPRNLAGHTVNFVMYDAAGNLAVAETPATITDETLGHVQYDFQALDVSVPGRYYGFFKDYIGAEPDTWPPDDDGIEIEIFAHDEVRTPHSVIGLTDEELHDAAMSPKRTRTVEGTVEERSINELIALDRYQKSQTTNAAVPWGMRIAKTKPPSTLS